MKGSAAIRRFMRRVRAVPATTEQIAAMTAELPGRFHDVASRVSAEAERTNAATQLQSTDLADAVAALHVQTQAWQVAVAQQLQGSFDVVRADVAVSRQEMNAQRGQLDDRMAAVDHRARVVLEASLAAQRDAAFVALCAGLQSPACRVEGLSVMVITWNHAGWLPEALASAVAALEALPAGLAGQILILDDGSSDETGAVLGPLETDTRFRIVRSPSNLGLSRARNVLLSICPTRHALILDADNRVLADGTAVLYETARSMRSAITWGHVIAATEDGLHWHAYSYAPSPESLRHSHCFDSMCVIDVEAIEQLGGYSRDPQLAGVADDFELLLRCLRRGVLVGFVPAVLGRYRISPYRHSAQVADQRLIESRLTRAYLYDDLDFDRCSIIGAHPAVGVLWASSGAIHNYGIRPTALPAPVQQIAPRHRILVVAPGGVGNIGDDAITDAVVERVRRVHPHASIEIVSDRDVPLTRSPVPWAGTVGELWQGLTDDDLDRAVSAAGGDVERQLLTSPTRTLGTTLLTSFDAVVFAGGGNLASAFSVGQLRPRVAIALAFGGHGIPVMWSGQGLGPCTGEELTLLGAAIRSASAFGCRDAGSVNLFDENIRTRLSLVGDDAMSLVAADDETIDAALRRSGVETDRYVVLHLRSADYVGPYNNSDLLHAVDCFAAKSGATVLGMCVNDNEPAEASVFAHAAQAAPRQTTWRAIEATGSPALVRGLMRRADAVVSHSYHLALWALQEQTPTLLVAASDYYRAKADGLADLAGFAGTIAFSPTDDADSIRPLLHDVLTWLPSSRLPDAAARVERWSDECMRELLPD
ncbi:MAG TPA: polysaccharide pyruvyl transferase family protein [Ilumatobacteraceae bacterium]|nr:polysaccharide pyruvyl transferase family protein [Ilumatobacteraceae bacterium]HRB03128.1 polysaccharide pyruvyl transferase family protein [Ilumatobacteraceae bacterium]